MKLGQTSVIHFLSSLAASALGFFATVYIARQLGAGPLGTYHLVLSLVSWLGIVGNVGFTKAITKRVSEGEQREQYTTAGIVIILSLFIVVMIAVVIFQKQVNNYLGSNLTGYVLLLLFATLLHSLIQSLLGGVHLVHINGILSPVKTGTRSLSQIAALTVGFGLIGLFIGYTVGYLLTVIIGSIFVFRRLNRLKLPKKRHFQSLFSFAKFSWLGGLSSKMFNYTDVIILGFFVPSTLIGIYSVAWSISQFLTLFSSAITTTLFPEMSEISTGDHPEQIDNLLEDALAYAGLLLIPGLVGGYLLGGRLLRIYGGEFSQGATVLVILIVANLVMSYQSQFTNAFDAIDRPDLSFQVNTVFVIANVLLNVVLIYIYGWVGAAVATASSGMLSLTISYLFAKDITNIHLPVYELSQQLAAALLMGVCLVFVLRIESNYDLDAYSIYFTVATVFFGACVYFVALLVISSPFKNKVRQNIPI